MATSNHSHSRPQSATHDSPNHSSRSGSSHGVSSSSIRKEPALGAVESPPLTSSLHSRNSASSQQETAYLKKLFLLRCARLTATALIVGLAVGIIACEADVLKRYNDTNLDGAWSLPLWPADIDVRPTVINVTVASVSIGLSLLYIIIAFIPSPHSRTTVINASFSTLSSLGLILVLCAVIYSPLFINRIFSPFANPTQMNESRQTIQTWTCSLYNNVNIFNKDAAVLQLPTLSTSTGLVEAPQGFRRICTESRVSYGLMIGLLAMEVFAVSVGMVGIGLEKRMATARKVRYERQEFEKA